MGWNSGQVVPAKTRRTVNAQPYVIAMTLRGYRALGPDHSLLMTHCIAEEATRVDRPKKLFEKAWCVARAACDAPG